MSEVREVRRSSIDWGALAEAAGLINETTGGGFSERGGTLEAERAICGLLGDDVLIGAVNHAIKLVRGSNLAQSVLRILRPPSAMDRCRQIWLSDADEEARGLAIWLLKDIADNRVLEWVPDFLSDRNQTVQRCGIMIVDQLILDGFASIDDVMYIINLARDHPDAFIREQALNVLNLHKGLPDEACN